MKTSTWAKIAGWLQFGLVSFGQVAQSISTNGAPHGAFSWIGLVASLATAVAVHGAAGTDGTK